jgi:uncharacterized protein
VAQQPSIVDLARLSLSFGEAATLDVPIRIEAVTLGGQGYVPRSSPTDARLDVSRSSSAYVLRLRFSIVLEGPCQRCLEPAELAVDVDSREVDQAGAQDEELQSPYVHAEELDVSGWARDAIALALPSRILCRTDCAGLCTVCGESLNDADPADHEHQSGGDPRWAKLRELSE